MKVRELMITDVATLPPCATLREAAGLMRSRGIGSVPVTEDGTLTGIVTDRDIALFCAVSGASCDEITVSEASTKAPLWISPDHSVTEAARLMARSRIRRLPVCRDGKLVGILSLSDIARAKNFFAEAASAFCDICKE